MLFIRSLPDSIERATYRIALVGGAIPTFEAGEMVETIYDAVLGEPTIRKIANGTNPTTTPYPIFRGTEGNSTVEGMGRTTVIKREWYGETDMYDATLIGQAAGVSLTVLGNANNEGVWSLAGAGDRVFGTLKQAILNGVIVVERVAHPVA